MIKVIVVDDEPLARSIILDYLEDFADVKVVAECGDGFEAAKAIAAHQPDLVFLDIQMPKISGFELLELLDEKPNTIFTTAFDEYAIKAFEQHAIDYLLKPISKERFEAAIQKFRRLRAGKGMKPDPALFIGEQMLERVVVKYGGTKIKIIPVDDIIYLRADDDYVQIHTAEGLFLKKDTMAAFEKRLDPSQFVRIHRSFIVQVDHLDRIEPYEKESFLAVLKTGDKLNVSKAGYARLKLILGM